MVQRQDKGASQTLKAVLGVRDLVFSSLIAPGERLSEISISERLGLSRTPVRAALARLEQEGILEAIPSGGYSVRQFSEADVADAIELRGVLEGTAARLAAERGVAPARLAAVRGSSRISTRCWPAERRRWTSTPIWRSTPSFTRCSPSSPAAVSSSASSNA